MSCEDTYLSVGLSHVVIERDWKLSIRHTSIDANTIRRLSGALLLEAFRLELKILQVGNIMDNLFFVRTYQFDWRLYVLDDQFGLNIN